MKSEQLEVITGILRRDVFVVLPTGLFPVFASTIDRLFPEETNSIIIVVTPLTAIMKDQKINRSL